MKKPIQSIETEISDLQSTAKRKGANTDLLIKDAFNRGFIKGAEAYKRSLKDFIK